MLVFISVLGMLNSMPGVGSGTEIASATSLNTVVSDIAYIHGPDKATTDSYQKLLVEHGYTVDLIAVESAAKFDYSAYKLIIIGPDTQSPTNYYDWAGDAAAVNKAGKPILGLGRGGASFFQEIGRSINWGKSWVNYETKMHVMQPCHRVFNTPYQIPIPMDCVISVYEKTTNVAPYGPVIAPEVVLLGRELSDGHHYTLVYEESPATMLWGYDASPAAMTTTGKQLFINAVTFMIAPPPKPQLSGAIAYIHATDKTTASIYKEFLAAQGYTVTLIDVASAARTDYSAYKLIIIGPDTQSPTNYYDWAGDAAAVNKAGKPILGLGRGGSSFFQEIGQSINWGHCWVGGENRVYASCRPCNPIFSAPYLIPIPDDRIITVYRQTSHVGAYEPVLDPGVVLYGRESRSTTHYTLVQEKEYMLWGYDEDPGLMTSVGQKLFINVVAHMITYPPTPKLAGKIAFIYSNSPIAETYADLLVSHGFTVDSIPIAETARRDFSQYCLVIVGPETGYNYDWYGPADHVYGSGTPILGLGKGGTNFFEAWPSMTMNWGNSWLKTEHNQMYVPMPCHNLFRVPYPICVPASKVINVYYTTSSIGLYAPVLSNHAELIGREADNLDHWTLVREPDESGLAHMIWGYDAGPSQMTPTGKQLFINVVSALCKTPPPITITPITPVLTPIPITKLPVVTVKPRCSLTFDKIYGIKSPESGYAKVVVTGYAEGCKLVEVTINCAGNPQSEIVPVDSSGFWQATFDGTVSECICEETRLDVTACCVEPKDESCCIKRTLERLPCIEPEVEESCAIYIHDVIGEKDPTGGLTITVTGTATKCKVVEITVSCRARAITRATVNPDGSWKAVLNGRLAECECNNPEIPITITACCIEPLDKECCASLTVRQLPCETPTEDCLVGIKEVLGVVDPTGAYVEKVIVRGFADNCRKVQVTIHCGANQQTTAAVDSSGSWEAVLSGRLAECKCEGMVTVDVCCVDPPVKECCASLTVRELTCLKAEEIKPVLTIQPLPPLTIVRPEECAIKITDVFGEGVVDSNLIERLHVRGVADGCEVVAVSIFCHSHELLMKAKVDPATGRWEAIFGREAECLCGKSQSDIEITVKAWCLVPDLPNCADYMRLAEIPCRLPQECKIWIEGLYTEIAEPQVSAYQVTRVIVWGAADGCEGGKIQVTIACGEKYTTTAEVDELGNWKVALDGIKARCLCGRPIYIEVCCIDAAGAIKCCDFMELKELPCPEIEIPPEECFIEIVDVFGKPMVTAAGVEMHVRGIAKGCRVVEVTVTCADGQEHRAKAEVDPATGRWEAILYGCKCDEVIFVKACCLVPELDCCTVWDERPLRCIKPEEPECQIWIEGGYPERDPDDPNRIHRVTIVGSASDCYMAQVTIKCGDQILTETAEVDDSGYWKVTFDVSDIKCVCNEIIVLKACCVNEAGEITCCDSLEMRWPCREEKPPVTTEVPPEECLVEIKEVIPEQTETEAGETVITHIIVVGVADGCNKVEVHLACRQKLVETAEVIGGEWKVEFDGREAGCVCEEHIEVTAICVDPPIGGCFDTLILERVCEPTPITVETTPAETEPITRLTTPAETTPGAPAIPGFGLFEVLFAVLTLLGLAKLRAHR